MLFFNRLFFFRLLKVSRYFCSFMTFLKKNILTTAVSLYAVILRFIAWLGYAQSLLCNRTKLLFYSLSTTSSSASSSFFPGFFNIHFRSFFIKKILISVNFSSYLRAPCAWSCLVCNVDARICCLHCDPSNKFVQVAIICLPFMHARYFLPAISSNCFSCFYQLSRMSDHVIGNVRLPLDTNGSTSCPHIFLVIDAVPSLFLYVI